MHMADALISPAVGGTMWAAAAGLAAYSAKKIRDDPDERKVPLMGVIGAFVFAAQMINFTIPGTGSSGHLGGSLILAILLGPYAGFLTIFSVLTIQAMFFADGGILALGCNVFNLGFYPCFIAYPLFKLFIKDQPSQGRILLGSILAAVIGLQLGAFSVVLETLVSGISDLPFKSFVLLMQPIHLAIGVVEGLITAAVATFVWRARPEIIERTALGKPYGAVSLRRVLIGLGLMAVLTGGALSWFASTHPDGLEWSMFRASGREEPAAPAGIHETLERVQKGTAFLPDYGFNASESSAGADEEGTVWPAVSGGTTVAGLVGAAMTLALAVLIAVGLRSVKRRNRMGGTA